MTSSIENAISDFGKAAKSKLANPSATGQPEDQLRAPFEQLLEDVAALCSFRAGAVVAVGETVQRDLKTRPDYSITVDKVLVGFVELKERPERGQTGLRFKDPHDREQWNAYCGLAAQSALHRIEKHSASGRTASAVGTVLTLFFDIETAGREARAATRLITFSRVSCAGNLVPPRSARELAHTTARLCGLLRDEVTEQLALQSRCASDQTDRRKLLFSRGDRRKVCGRLRTGGHLRNAYGAGERHCTQRGAAQGR